jgi:AcrR family transcriptional regulator
MSATQLGLRERKKLRTRATIIDVAFKLFAEQGYHETTLVQIAEMAEISPSTFFNYFPAKVDIVFGVIDAITESARTRIEMRDPAEPTVTTIVSWVREDLLEVERPYFEVLRLLPIVAESVPELVAEQRLRLALLEDVFAQGFAAELSEPADGMKARVMSAIAVRGMTEVWLAWYEHHMSDATFDPTELVAIKAEFLEKALNAGLAAIQTLPAPPEDA